VTFSPLSPVNDILQEIVGSSMNLHSAFKSSENSWRGDIYANSKQSFQFELEAGQIEKRRNFGGLDQDIQVAAFTIIAARD